MAGAEYVTPAALRALWADLDAAFAARLAGGGATVQDVLRTFHAAWNTVGRVHFHLAENRRDPDAPFAFLATYTHGLSAQGKPRHVPLGRALQDYGGAANRAALLSLLVPVQRAAERCGWLRTLVEGGEIYHPLRWTAAEALALLRDVHALEDAGVIVRVPAHWKGGRPPRPTVVARVGAKPARGGLGLESLLDFSVEVTLDGETLTPAEIRSLLRATEGLAFLRGRWVEIDRGRLGGMIDRFSRIEQTAARQGVTFAEAMRLVAGADTRIQDAPDDEDRAWAGVEAGPWLAGVLQGLRSPDALGAVEPGARFQGSLRPYQQVGVRWLHFLSSLGLGACLADDMGLGKTVQLLALLVVLRRENAPPGRAHLLVAPASVLANWAAEIARFAPSLSTFVAHPSALPAAGLKTPDPERLSKADIVLTTYGTVRRLPWICGDRLGPRRPGRGAGDQEPGGPADARRQGAPFARADRADRHADREPPRRPLVPLRLPQPGPARVGAAVHRDDEAPGRAAAQRLRPAARPRASLHPATPQDRPARDLRPSRQDRGERLLPAQPRPGRPLRAGGARPEAAPGWGPRGHRAPRPGARLADAPEADLQPPLALAGRPGLEPRRQRQVGAPGRDRRRHRGAPGEAARLHAVPRDDRAARRLPGGGCWAGPAWCCTAARR